MEMVENFGTPGLFFDKNLVFIEANYYEHFYFLKMRERLIDRKFKALDWFNVSDGERLIMCICTEAGICIYASDFTPLMLDQLYERITRTRYTNIRFIGGKEIITELFTRFAVPFDIHKDRIIYKTDAVLRLKKKHMGQAVNANMTDYHALVNYSYAYSLEEWGEREGRGIDYVQAMVNKCIEQQTLIQYDIPGGIGCIAQVLNLEDDMPLIGSLFTPTEYRGNGYATMLVHAITRKLLESGYQECGIISDATNSYMNKMFANIGYKPIPKHIDLMCKDFNRTN